MESAMPAATALKIQGLERRQRAQLRAVPSKSRFDLNIPEFRAHLRAITGLDFDATRGLWKDSPPLTPKEVQWGITWWNTATEEDARNMRFRSPEDQANGVPYWENTGEPRDMSTVWLVQTRKIQLVWDAWKAGRRILLNEIQHILQKEFRY
jgi:hypothetical protein